MVNVSMIRRFYLEEFDEKIHESTADLQIVDLCEKCHEDIKDLLFEEEENIPDDLFCDLCKDKTWKKDLLK